MPGDGWRSKEDMFGLKIEPQHVIIRPFLMKLQVAKVCAQWAQTRRPGHSQLRGTSDETSYLDLDRIVCRHPRFEENCAFSRAPEGAHIFPKAKYNGGFKWLDDKEDFNRIAFKQRWACAV